MPGLSCDTQDLLCSMQGLLVVACMQDSSSPTRDRTQAPCIGSTESYPLDHQGSPLSGYLLSSAFWSQSKLCGASLLSQWLRIHLPLQGTWVQALVQEDPTCRGATKPMRHNCWGCVLEPVSHNSWAHMPQLLKPMRLEPVLCNKRSHRNEKPVHRNEE